MDTPEMSEYAHTADRFGAIVAGVADWDAPTPVAEWRARDIVGHLTTWLPGLLASDGIDLQAGSSDHPDDPVRTWAEFDAALRALLADRGGDRFSHPMAGEGSVAGIVARLFTPDVFVHTWDLARSSGQPDRLDAARCTAMLDGMRGIEPMLRASGQFGVQQPEPPDADATDRLMAFLGRNPRWQPDG